MEFIQIGLEMVVGYFALLVLTTILGKNQLSQITAFDFISALVIGELVGNSFFDDNIGIPKILFAVFIWGTLVYVTEMITQKFRKTRPLLEGSPSIIIHKGKINFEQLKKNHLDINQLQHLLRSKDVFSIRDCAYAILETDGSLSVLKNPEKETVTKSDLNIPTTKASLPVSVILDGEIVEQNLKMIGWDKETLLSELKKQGYNQVEDILYAEWFEDQPLLIQTY